jgi:lipopolysaccharide biosynthesis glycosyltransferase
MDDQIKLVFCFDKGYIQYAKTAIKSLLKNKTRDIFIYIIVSGAEKEDLICIDHLLCAFDVEYKIFYVDYSKLDFCKPMRHLKIPTYLRLLIPSLIHEKKIIYSDCDIYVNGDLGELFDLNISENIIGAAKDDHGKPCEEKLNLKNESYFNAGVLRWDLDKINRETFLEECREVYLKHEKELSFGDQCMLNILYKNKKTTIRREWNEQVVVNYTHYPVLEYFIQNKRKIIHFCGAAKPWDCDFGEPGWKFWHKYMI